MLKLIFGTSKAKAFVVTVDTIGYTTDNSVVGGAFTPMSVMKAINDNGIDSKSSTWKALISGLAGEQKSGIECNQVER